MAQAWSPASTISRSMRCRSSDSAVVSCTGVSTPPIRLTTVPSRPQRRPAAGEAGGQKCAVVVLPLVPVTAATCSAARGVAVPARRHVRHGTARRRHQHLRDGQTPSGRSHTSAGGAGGDRRRRESWPSALGRGCRRTASPARRRACDRPDADHDGRVAGDLAREPRPVQQHPWAAILSELTAAASPSCARRDRARAGRPSGRDLRGVQRRSARSSAPPAPPRRRRSTRSDAARRPLPGPAACGCAAGTMPMNDAT